MDTKIRNALNQLSAMEFKLAQMTKTHGAHSRAVVDFKGDIELLKHQIDDRAAALRKTWSAASTQP